MNWLETLLFKTLNEKLDKIILSQIAQGKQLDEILFHQKLERLHVSPELEAQVNLAYALAGVIDKKVPDKIVPPRQPQKRRTL